MGWGSGIYSGVGRPTCPKMVACRAWSRHAGRDQSSGSKRSPGLRCRSEKGSYFGTQIQTYFALQNVLTVLLFHYKFHVFIYMEWGAFPKLFAVSHLLMRSTYCGCYCTLYILFLIFEVRSSLAIKMCQIQCLWFFSPFYKGICSDTIEALVRFSIQYTGLASAYCDTQTWENFPLERYHIEKKIYIYI